MVLISSSVVKGNPLTSLLTMDNVFIKGQREVLLELLTTGQPKTYRPKHSDDECVCTKSQ